MRLLARSRVFLILAGLVLVIFIVGLFWPAAFYDDAEGFPRTFRAVWQVVLLPPEFLLSMFWAVGGNPTGLAALAALAIYLSAFVGLDRLVARIATRFGHDAA